MRKKFNDMPITFIIFIAIIALNCYVYYLELKFNNLNPNISTYTAIHFGASYGTLDFHGQLYRLFTAMWAHLSFWHIVSNMLALWLFVKMVTPIYYSYQVITIYLLSGIGGTLISAIVNPNIVAAGASTAISGLIGAMLGMIALPSINGFNKAGIINYGFQMLVLNTIGAIGTNVDIAGHTGGALVGFIISLIFCLFKRHHYNMYGE